MHIKHHAAAPVFLYGVFAAPALATEYAVLFTDSVWVFFNHAIALLAFLAGSLLPDLSCYAHEKDAKDRGEEVYLYDHTKWDNSVTKKYQELDKNGKWSPLYKFFHSIFGMILCTGIILALIFLFSLPFEIGLWFGAGYLLHILMDNWSHKSGYMFWPRYITNNRLEWWEWKWSVRRLIRFVYRFVKRKTIKQWRIFAASHLY